MRRNSTLAFSVLALFAACSGGKPAPTDDLSGLASVDEKSDAFSHRMKIVGSLVYGQTSDAVAYTNPPRYRAFKFAGQVGDKVDIWVRSPDGDAVAWLLSGSFRTLASNDDADDTTTDSHMTFTLTANRTYYIVFREYSLADATFTVELTGPGCYSGGKEYKPGTGFPSSDGCNVCSCLASGRVICTERACPIPSTDFFSCTHDGDCVAVPKAGCCHNGYLEAVNVNQVDAYNAANACTDPRPICPLFLIQDKRVARCDFTANKCQLVDPQGARCGGFILNAPTCPDGYQCDFRGRVPDVGGVCEQICGGTAALSCPNGVSCNLDSTCTASGGADCGGLCY
jgi:hypothetical protein